MKCKLVVKKLFAVLLSCSMLVSALTGCGSTESETESSSATEEVVK